MPRKRNFDINKAHSFMLTIVLFSYNMEDIGEHDSNFPKYPDFERIKKHVLKFYHRTFYCSQNSEYFFHFLISCIIATNNMVRVLSEVEDSMIKLKHRCDCTN